MLSGSPFIEIAIILSLATVLGILGRKLKQPLIIMFLATGIIAGPAFLGLIHSHEQIELLAEIGIALLLFIVGLKLDLHLIRTTGPVALATGLGQIVFTSLIGFAIALAMNMTYLSAAYVAVALTFSSTIIIVKLLSDKKEIDSLHGQIAIGFLIVQDIAAIIALVGLTTFGSTATNDSSTFLTVVDILGKGIGFIGGIALLMKFVLPRLVNRLADNKEVLILFAISWAVFLGAMSEILGFSKEVGAFLAGISLASTRYRDAIGARLTSLRDFLLLFFFIDLGARLEWTAMGAQIGESVIFSIFVLIGNPLIVLIIMGWMGYRRRTGLLAGLTVAQISEFSLIVAALGLSLGHISNQTMGLITLVGVVTISISTYMILYSNRLYNLLSKPLKIFERKDPYRETAIDTIEETVPVDVVLVGLGNYGSEIMDYLLRRNKKVLGVDFDPNVVDEWRQRGISALYADISDPEIHDHLPLDKAQWVISTVRSKELNLTLLNFLKHHHYHSKIGVTAINEQEAKEFRQMGANLVFRPFKDASEQAADALTYTMDFLPENVDWPISFLEIRVKSDSATAGKTLNDLQLSKTGVSVLAVSRGGNIHYEPEYDFHIYPGDRILLIGPPDRLKEEENLLNLLDSQMQSQDIDHFEISEININANSSLDGQSLRDLNFRKTYGATVIGIRRGENNITSITPSTTIHQRDTLIVVGKAKTIEALKQQVL